MEGGKSAVCAAIAAAMTDLRSNAGRPGTAGVACCGSCTRPRSSRAD